MECIKNYTGKIFLSLAFVILLACDDDPVITTAEPGAVVAYFGGVVNNSVSVTATLPASRDGSELHISAKFLEPDTARIDFSIATDFINEAIQPGEYVIKGNNPAVPMPAFFYLPSDKKGLYNSQYYPAPIAGRIYVSKLDRVNKIVSGSFEVYLIRNGETIYLSNGSFNSIPFTE